MRRYDMEETGEQQVDDEQHVEVEQNDEEENMIRRRKRPKKLATVVQHEQQGGDEQVDAHQGTNNQNDEEEGVIRRSKRIKKLAAVVQTPYTIPRRWREIGVNSWPAFAVVGPNGKLLEQLSGEGRRKDLDDLVEAALLFYGEKKLLDNDPRLVTSPLKFPQQLALHFR
ncbi:hypothetical protein LWI28_024496 [Acer negundo]|uniref:Uncharacterized protein n=1 Tax=Acer negundo TaxID=4023 RepID=A0AAD5IH32_ACENE|nr:hypothetical protein LWI28_024496 [Acer negundo]